MAGDLLENLLAQYGSEEPTLADVMRYNQLGGPRPATETRGLGDFPSFLTLPSLPQRHPGYIENIRRPAGAFMPSEDEARDVGDFARAGKWGPALAGATVLGVGAIGPRKSAAPRIDAPVRVHHGTPNWFAPEEGAPLGRFRPDKIGTGEGFQSYMYGHYFAGEPPVAEYYRQALAGRADPRTFTAADYAGHHLNFTRMGGQVPEPAARQRSLAFLDSAIRDAEESASRSWLGRLLNRPSQTDMTGQPIAAPVPIDMLREARSLLASGKENPTPRIGRVLDVDLHVRPDQLLDLDKPLSQQSEAVRRAVETDQRLSRLLPMPFRHGDALLVPLQRNARATADAFRDAGIPGAVYNAGQIAGWKGAPSRNHIMFPGTESMIDIVRQYAMPPAIAAPALAALLSQYGDEPTAP